MYTNHIIIISNKSYYSSTHFELSRFRGTWQQCFGQTGARETKTNEKQMKACRSEQAEKTCVVFSALCFEAAQL